jgi:hypothetical protein
MISTAKWVCIKPLAAAKLFEIAGAAESLPQDKQ